MKALWHSLEIGDLLDSRPAPRCDDPAAAQSLSSLGGLGFHAPQGSNMAPRLVARLGDRSSSDLSAACTASANVLIQNKPALRKGDRGQGGWRAVSGASHVLVNGRQIHRVRDRHSGCEQITSCTTVVADDSEGTPAPRDSATDTVTLRIRVLDCRTDEPVDKIAIEHLAIDAEVLVPNDKSTKPTTAKLVSAGQGIVALSLALDQIERGFYLHLVFRDFAVVAETSRADFDSGAPAISPPPAKAAADGPTPDDTPEPHREVFWRGPQFTPRATEAAKPWGWWLRSNGAKRPFLRAPPLDSPGSLAEPPTAEADSAEVEFHTAFDLTVRATQVSSAACAWDEVQQQHGDLCVHYPEDRSAEIVLRALVWCQPVWDDLDDEAVPAPTWVSNPDKANRHMHLVTTYFDVGINPSTKKPNPGSDYGKLDTPTRGSRIHLGYDVYARCGAPLFAVHGGKAVGNQTTGAAGNMLTHTFVGRTLDYLHLTDFAPPIGPAATAVRAGQILGFAGRTGNLGQSSRWPTHVHLQDTAIRSVPEEGRIVMPSNSLPLAFPCNCEVTLASEDPSACSLRAPLPGGSPNKFQKTCWALREKKCPHTAWQSRYHPVLRYILSEMQLNSSGKPASEIRAHLEAARPKDNLDLLSGRPGWHALQALARWTSLVKPGGPWDHKARIRGAYGDYQQLGGPSPTDHEYSYDVWSNIHYGYVGRAVGLPEDLLLEGAGLAQTLTALKSVQSLKEALQRARDEGMRGIDDPHDQAAIRLGFSLFGPAVPDEASLASTVTANTAFLASRFSSIREVPPEVPIAHLE